MNSNYTLRFNRTSREAYGRWLTREDFEGDRGDRFVFWIAVAIGFVLGLLIK